jgi:hypothetical protein
MKTYPLFNDLEELTIKKINDIEKFVNNTKEKLGQLYEK